MKDIQKIQKIYDDLKRGGSGFNEAVEVTQSKKEFKEYSEAWDKAYEKGEPSSRIFAHFKGYLLGKLKGMFPDLKE